MTEQGFRIFWSDEEKAFVSVDALRPGCRSDGVTELAAFFALQDARHEWDKHRRMKDIDG